MEVIASEQLQLHLVLAVVEAVELHIIIMIMMMTTALGSDI